MLFNSPFLEIIKRLSPIHPVCEENGETLTVEDLLEKSTSLALYLSAKGLKKDDHVLLACEGGTEFLILFMALIHLRVKTALVDPHMGRQRYWSKVKQFKPQWAFIDSRLLLLQEHPVLRWFYLTFGKNPFYIPYSSSYKVVATGYKLPLVQKHLRLKYKEETIADFQEGNDNDELVLVYTSGTLEEPKAVVHTVQSLYQSLLAVASIVGKEKQGSLATHLPHFALIGMMNGLKTYFWKEKWSAEKRIKFIEKNKITILFGPPAEFLPLMDYCNQHAIKFPPGLNHLIFGSAPVLKPFLMKVKKMTDAKITCLYGMTENLVVAQIDGDEKMNYEGNGDILGKPVSGLEYTIEKDGELLIRSEMLYKRYLHLNQRDPFHATGDLVFQDDQGRLLMKGRKKNMIIRGHKNIYPGLYESTINSIPGVREAVMVGIYNDQRLDEEVYLLIEGDDSLTERKIRAELKQGKYSIDSDAHPDKIIFMSIPKSGRQQKTDKKKILEIISSKRL